MLTHPPTFQSLSANSYSAKHLKGDVTHGVHPVLGRVLLSSEHVRLVVGFHAERRHVFFGTALRQRREDGYALGQADDLFVQFPGFFIGPASRPAARPAAPARGRVEELEAGDAILAGGVEDEPVLLPFLLWWERRRVIVVCYKTKRLTQQRPGSVGRGLVFQLNAWVQCHHMSRSAAPGGFDKSKG